MNLGYGRDLRRILLRREIKKHEPLRNGRQWVSQAKHRLYSRIVEGLQLALGFVAYVQSILREWKGRKGQPTAVYLDSRALQSTPESGTPAGYDGAKRGKGSKVHIAVATLGQLLALTVTAADEGDRTQVAALAQDLQQVTGNTVERADVDQVTPGRTPPKPDSSTAYV